MNEGWTRKPLGQIVTLQRGFDLPKRLRSDGDVPVISSSGAEDHHDDPIKMGPGVVTGRYGTIGKVFFVDGPYWPLNTTLFVSNFHSNDPRFCYYLLQSFDFSDHSGKSGVPGVNRNDLHAIEVAFPKTLHEQQAIAATLSDADGAVAGLQRVIAKKRLIKQGAMQDLLTARRRLPGFSGEWEVRPFAQIARIRNSKVQTLGNPVAQSCIELEQIEHETGRVLFWVDATARPTVKYQFEPGDVLFGRLRPYLRKFHRATVQGVCSTEIWPLMSQGIDSGFLYQVVQSSGFVAAACEAYGTHMPRADWGKLATFEVQVPVDPKEQVAIGEALNDMEKEIQTLESRLTKARAVKEGMMQNLLTGRVRLV